MSVYEVRCPSCRVSFPPETKRCIHCGGRTAPPGASPELLAAASSPHAGPMGPAEVDEVELPATRLPVRVMSLVWIALAIAVSFWRVCAGE